MDGPRIIDARVLLEACPPALEDQEKAYAFLRQSFSCYNSFHGVSVPDIQDSGEFGRTRSRVSNGEFAAWVGKLTSKPLSLYKVCTSCTADEFTDWLERAGRLGCNNIILVGGDSSTKDYRDGALQVGAAAQLARNKGFDCGGIIIPTRRKQFVSRPASLDETERLLVKVREHGITFFSTQILYEGE